MYFLVITLLSLNIIPCISQEKYKWDNVAIGGGGYVTDIVIHPKEKDLVYIRTDVGGLFKWDNKNERWNQLLDWVDYNNVNYRNVDGMAIDPNNPDLIYIAAGNDVLKSNNRGFSWKHTGLNKEFMGNGDYRWVGENSLGKNGLWKSSDGGEKFIPDTFFEAARCLAWGKQSADSSFPTAYVYGAHKNVWGLFRSVNLGKTWQQINDKEHSLA